MKKLIALSALSFLALSCEKAIDYELTQEPPKLAIDAHIEPGTPIKAFISVSEFVLSNDQPSPPEDATVILYEDGNPVDYLTYEKPMFPGDPQWFVDYEPYRGTYIPKTGHTYRLEAADENITTAYGQGYTREPVTLEEVDFDMKRYTLDLSFTDPETEGDYYRIRVYLKQYNSSKNPIWTSTYDPFVEYPGGGEGGFSVGEDAAKSGLVAFLSDESFNGKTRSVRFTNVAEYYYLEENTDHSLMVELNRVSEDLYLHEMSKAANMNSDGNPFAEPVPIYSNVVNGYGIVAAIATDSAVVEF